jgi:hypothetical protein
MASPSSGGSLSYVPTPAERVRVQCVYVYVCVSIVYGMDWRVR